MTFDFEIQDPVRKLIAWAKRKFPDISWEPWNWTFHVIYFDDGDFQIELVHRRTVKLPGPFKKAFKEVKHSFFYQKSKKGNKYWYSEVSC